MDLAFQSAVGHAKAGRLTEAESLCREILSHDSAYAPAWHLKGTLLMSAGQPDKAEEAFQKAVELEPSKARYQNELGVSQAMQGKMDAAILTFSRAVDAEPSDALGHYNLGYAYERSRRWDGAIAAYQKALALRPQYPQALNNLANVLRQAGRTAEAIEAGQKAIALQPNFFEAHLNLGNALLQQGMAGQAIAIYQQAIALRPASPDAYNNLANALNQAGQSAEAIENYKKAVALRPDFAGALTNLANLQEEAGDFDAALASLNRALMLQPGNARIYNSLGNALGSQGRLDEALDAFQRAIELEPGYMPPRLNLAHVYLAKGDLANGFAGYETRPQRTVAFDSESPAPLWDGRELKGQRILLRVEQGQGDIIQFVRYVPMVRQRGGLPVMQLPRSLVELLRGQCGIEEAVGHDEPMPQADVQYPLLSLPNLFQTRLETIPAKVPYLCADPALVDEFQKRIDLNAFNVGLNWAGKAVPDRRRSFPLSALAPLAEIEGVRFHSLQKGPQATEAFRPPYGMELSNLLADFEDFAHTAALMASMDLVITCDTSVAHLAGAMGLQTWILLSFAADWRWLRNRSDSPWYPTARLFRQTKTGDWTSVITEVAEALRNAHKEPRAK
ncbi:MAG TPA: tetratricopeptide repeat protein [Bryobacteraceae bacterium]|nr:tetratricopeptide repeat protein [Bryobacteraceae bacterium]